MKNRFIGMMLAAAVTAAAFPADSVSAYPDITIIEDRDTLDGISREYIQDGETGTYSLTKKEKGHFRAEWTNVRWYEAEVGRSFSKLPNWDCCQTLTVDYGAFYTCNGASFFGVHGWMKDALAEYYIVQDWTVWRPSSAGAEQECILTVGTSRYTLFSTQKQNVPTIEGVKDSKQYWSVRTDRGAYDNAQQYLMGKIDVKAHFDAWADCGMLPENAHVESCNLYVWTRESTGFFDVDRFEMASRWADKPVKQDEEPPKTVSDENGIFFRSDFEKDAGGWELLEDTDLNSAFQCRLDGRYYAEGKQSLRVTNRTSGWDSASKSLNPYALIAGRTYRIQAAVMQAEAETAEISLELAYCDADGEQCFETLAKETCARGEWTLLKNDAFQFPETVIGKARTDADGKLVPRNACRLFLTTDNETFDIWLDDVVLAEDNSEMQADLSKSAPNQGYGSVEPKTVQYPARSGDAAYLAHQNKQYSFVSGGQGFKDIMGPYFRIGGSLNGTAAADAKVRDFYKYHFNSVSLEHELLPDAVIKEIDGTDVTVDLSAADRILKFAEQNGIGVRGSGLIRHERTPDAMYAGTPEEADARIESLIKAAFAKLKADYPELKLYAYDVCSDMFRENGGGLRTKTGDDADTSRWAAVYGDDNSDFIVHAFKTARANAPADCKLYLSDHNEYNADKTDDICGMAKKIMQAGDYIDGIAMQSHLDTVYPDRETYESACKKFAALGLDMQITELEISDSLPDDAARRALWKDVFRIAMTYADQISCVSMWNPLSTNSWTPNPDQNSLFTASMQPVPAYYDVLDLTDEITPPVMQDMPIVKPVRPASGDPLPVSERKGDANCDGSVDVADAVLIMRYTVSDTDAVISDQGVENGDVTGDGQTDATDAARILRYIAKKIRPFE